ncbi:MAG: hemerythrin domain-containing protein [Rhodoferax sp.]|jgi:hemerythrin-like domain-containing protein|nr:hemerythrin domain-containing protein [Rhodoferax sp.]MCB2043723.1 hemerythrin domain-containing protein [Rhodoferax sp.]MCW5630216.1 hemerythrin domain-containing protein [Rhodoferax sp.]
MRQPTTNPNRPGLPGHHAPSVGFEVPLEMLAACHGRVQHQCETLGRLVVHLAQHGADLQARQAATAVMRYFDTAARHHHADEEVDLFPALLESMAGSDAVCLRELTASLVADHRELEHHWSRLRRQLALVAAGQATRLTDDVVADFVSLYERHIAREESELLPMAQRLLSEEELDRIGLAMRVRRNAVEPPDTAAPA